MLAVFSGLPESSPGTLRKIPIGKFEKDETGHQPGHLQAPLPHSRVEAALWTG